MQTSLKILCFYFFIIAFYLSASSQENQDYYRLLDSADIHIDYSSEKAMSFLEAIPKPIEESIRGRVAEYYSLKSIIHDDFNEFSKYHQCVILAIKYAEKENKFCIAGEVSIGLFSNLYFIDKDDSAFEYLEKARAYYKKCDSGYGNVEVEQVEAYAKYLDGDYKACSNFLTRELENYKNIKEDPYYYMFALYLLTSNNIFLNDRDEAHRYFKEFKTLKSNPLLVKFNYYAFEGAINTSFADVFYKEKRIDSAHFYLGKTSKVTEYMAVGALKDYYRLNADVNKYLGKIDDSKVYIDSLMLFQSQIYDKTVEASFEVNESLLKAEAELMDQNKKKTFNSALAGFLIVSLLLLGLLSLYIYRTRKNNPEIANDQTNNSLSYLKSNNEQLAVKVFGLEEYIKNLKLEVKEISMIGSIEDQKEKIKELYNNLHINSSTVLDKSQNHLDLVNDLNIEFFEKIEKKHPQLNKSEIIICFYLIMAFTNKEIAVFLNTTVRSVESRRYRISKKIELAKKETTLLEHLQNTFSDTFKSDAIN